ncbi:hypothetical protein ABBQ32_006668 [Trebouxia sp. C0010 RCD-2024]
MMCTDAQMRLVKVAEVWYPLRITPELQSRIDMHVCAGSFTLSTLLNLRHWTPPCERTVRKSVISCKVDRRSSAAASSSAADDCCLEYDALQCRKQDILQPTRRRLLLGAATAAGSLGMPSPPQAKATRTVSSEGEEDLEVWEFKIDLRVVALKGSVPNQWVQDFKQALGKYGILRLHQKGQLQDIYSELGPNKKKISARTADAVTLGDSWLGPAIQAGYLQPLQDVESYRWWDAMAPRWRHLVTRNSSGESDSGGQVWAVPYRWGCTLVAYNREYLCKRGGVAIRDWSDLLQPRLRGRLAFLDSPREFVGVGLKTLGLPFNCSQAQLEASGITVGQLKERLQQLRLQVRVFSNHEHTRALTAHDVWAVVGSSTDLSPLASRSFDVSVTAPTSGTVLWADLWAVPAHATGGSRMQGPSPLLPAWLEFGLMPSRVQHSRGLQQGAAPLQLSDSVTSMSEGMQAGTDDVDELLADTMPDAQTLMRSEFLLPLDQETILMYNSVLGGLDLAGQ